MSNKSNRKAKTNTNLVSTNEESTQIESVQTTPTQTEIVETVQTEPVQAEIVQTEPVQVVDANAIPIGNVVATPQKQLGRPIVPGSARQIREAARAERKANGTFRLGRPIVPGCKKQIREAEYAAKIASGYIPKRGRPKMVKPAPETVTTTTVVAEETK